MLHAANRTRQTAYGRLQLCELQHNTLHAAQYNMHTMPSVIHPIFGLHTELQALLRCGLRLRAAGLDVSSLPHVPIAAVAPRLGGEVVPQDGV